MMNEENFQLAAKLLGKASNYVSVPQDARRTRERKFRDLLQHRKLPKESWDDQTIELLFHEVAALDSNNFCDNVGVGEREGRIYSDLVARRHFRMTHGIGRSGDLNAVQPKAAGSSILNKLCNALVLDVIRISGIKNCQSCFVAPLATGMAACLCMQYLRRKRISISGRCKYVIWSRIDQKSCFKSIFAAGLEPVVIDPILKGDELTTDVEGIKNAVKRLGPENIVCIFTTTSCFAPRLPDDVIAIAKLCQEYKVPHLVNNAYGLQASRCCNLIEQASRVGRIDLFVQSTDKNFMVPVGGAIVAGFDIQIVKEVAESYPGRASCTPSMDVVITLLSMGENGYRQLLVQRQENYQYLLDAMKTCAGEHGERILATKRNPISLAMSLDKLSETCDGSKSELTKLGSMLFTRHCSGARVVIPTETHRIEGTDFIGWGSHCANYPCPYLNVAAAIGMRKQEIDQFVRILDKALRTLRQGQSTDRSLVNNENENGVNQFILEEEQEGDLLSAHSK